jgi:hypothetical protein
MYMYSKCVCICLCKCICIVYVYVYTHIFLIPPHVASVLCVCCRCHAPLPDPGPSPGGHPAPAAWAERAPGSPMRTPIWPPMVPSGYVKIAIENGHRNSEFSHEKWWFSIVMLNYQRVIWIVHGYIMVNIHNAWRPRGPNLCKYGPLSWE